MSPKRNALRPAWLIVFALVFGVVYQYAYMWDAPADLTFRLYAWMAISIILILFLGALSPRLPEARVLVWVAPPVLLLVPAIFTPRNLNDLLPHIIIVSLGSAASAWFYRK